jgi:hypothetical protein
MKDTGTHERQIDQVAPGSRKTFCIGRALSAVVILFLPFQPSRSLRTTRCMPLNEQPVESGLGQSTRPSTLNDAK